MKANQLSDRKISATKKAGYLCDGGGLYLQVSQYGSKNWVFRFKSPELLRDREMGLGNLDTWSLAEARDRARECRQAVALGVDPIEQRRRKVDQVRATLAERVLFKDAAADYIALHASGWTNAKHAKQWHSTLGQYVLPKLGSRPVNEIDTALVNEVLAPIFTTIPETARRTKNRVERVCQWVREGKPLPHRGANKRVKHHAAIPVAELPPFMAELRKRDDIAARALEFCILTAARTSEVIGATWGEIDPKAGVWTVPANRMKAAKEHTVPLSKRAVEILKALPRAGDCLFPGVDGGRLGHSALLDALRDMAGNSVTVHGFRSTFRDWAGDQTGFPRDVIEHALAHKVKDKTEAAYRRSSALEKRRKLMDAWSGFCERPASSGNVVRLHGAA